MESPGCDSRNIHASLGLRESSGTGVPLSRDVGEGRCWVKTWGEVLLAGGPVVSKGPAARGAQSTCNPSRPDSAQGGGSEARPRRTGTAMRAWTGPESSREPGKGWGRAVVCSELPFQMRDEGQVSGGV